MTYGENEASHISEAREDKLDAHAGNVCGAHVGPVHERHAIHGANGDDETSVDAADDVGLLLFGEAIVIVLLGAELAGSHVEVLGLDVTRAVADFFVVVGVHSGNVLETVCQGRCLS